jgi:hypothetical protein
MKKNQLVNNNNLMNISLKILVFLANIKIILEKSINLILINNKKS